MIMRVEPIAAALDAIAAARGPSHRILLTPRGRRFDQAARARAGGARRASRWSAGATRASTNASRSLVDDQICIGDFVLAGGELAAAVVLEATARLVPGRARLRPVRGRRVVLGRAPRIPAVDASRRLERARRSPPVLLSGDHEAIARWRRRRVAAADPGAASRPARGPPAHRRGTAAAGGEPSEPDRPDAAIPRPLDSRPRAV